MNNSFDAGLRDARRGTQFPLVNMAKVSIRLEKKRNNCYTNKKILTRFPTLKP